MVYVMPMDITMIVMDRHVSDGCRDYSVHGKLVICIEGQIKGSLKGIKDVKGYAKRSEVLHMVEERFVSAKKVMSKVEGWIEGI
jgi:hypothetical protein